MASSNVKSAARLMSVLELLARQARPVPTMTIARECSIPKSSAHHLLNEMRSRDFVTYYEVDARGVAVDDEMVTPGISCVAAPVFSHEGTPVAAIGVTYVSAQRSRGARREAAELVCDASARLSANLGYARRSSAPQTVPA